MVCGFNGIFLSNFLRVFNFYTSFQNIQHFAEILIYRLGQFLFVGAKNGGHKGHYKVSNTEPGNIVQLSRLTAVRENNHLDSCQISSARVLTA